MKTKQDCDNEVQFLWPFLTILKVEVTLRTKDGVSGSQINQWDL